MFSPKPTDMSTITLSWDQCVSSFFFFPFWLFFVHVAIIKTSAAYTSLFGLILCEQAMAEQLAENYHSVWAKRKKLELEGKGTVSLFQLFCYFFKL